MLGCRRQAPLSYAESPAPLEPFQGSPYGKACGGGPLWAKLRYRPRLGGRCEVRPATRAAYCAGADSRRDDSDDAVRESASSLPC